MRRAAPLRSGDDADIRLRRQVIWASRACILLMAARGPQPSTAGAEAAQTTGSSPQTGPPPSTAARVTLSVRGTPSSPVVWRVHLGADRNRNAVLVAYETYVGTTVRLAEEPDPDDVALAQVALDPQLGRLRRALAASAASGRSQRGRVLAVARVETIRGNQAVVVGCLDSTAQRFYGPGDGPVPRSRASVSVSRVQMRRDDGRWKVSALAALPAGRCRR